jgi:hypothetical protein
MRKPGFTHGQNQGLKEKKYQSSALSSVFGAGSLSRSSSQNLASISHFFVQKIPFSRARLFADANSLWHQTQMATFPPG